MYDLCKRFRILKRMICSKSAIPSYKKNAELKQNHGLGTADSMGLSAMLLQSFLLRNISIKPEVRYSVTAGSSVIRLILLCS